MNAARSRADRDQARNVSVTKIPSTDPCTNSKKAALPVFEKGR